MKTKNLFASTVSLLLIGIMAIGCQPFTKESYLEKYKEFITEVKTESGDYDDKDWEKAEERYLKFSEEWYTKFEPEITVKEEFKIASWNVQYNALKGTSTLKDFVNFMFDDEDGLVTFLKEEYSDDVDALADDLKKKMDHYRKNQMEDDLNALKETIKSATDSIPELEKLLSY